MSHSGFLAGAQAGSIVCCPLLRETIENSCCSQLTHSLKQQRKQRQGSETGQTRKKKGFLYHPHAVDRGSSHMWIHITPWEIRNYRKAIFSRKWKKTLDPAATIQSTTSLTFYLSSCKFFTFLMIFLDIRQKVVVWWLPGNTCAATQSITNTHFKLESYSQESWSS